MRTKILLAIIFLCFNGAFAQKSISLTSEDKSMLMDGVVNALRQCISNFSGTYKPGTTIKEVVELSETSFEVSGTVSYTGGQCGTVRDTPYKITFYQEGSQAFGETCIYTPYCLWGVETSREWDCECRKWQYGSDNAAKGAMEIMMLLNKISAQN